MSIYIFICTSENIPQYRRLKSCDTAYAFERGKQENIDEIETGTYIYITDISTQDWFSLSGAHTTQTKPQSIYIFIDLFLASSNLNSTISTQHSDALSWTTTLILHWERMCFSLDKDLKERELNKVNIFSQEMRNALRYPWPFCWLK